MLNLAKRGRGARPLALLAGVLLTVFQADAVTLKPPAVGMYHGAFPDFSEYGVPNWAQKIADFEYLAGKKIVWAEVPNDWADGLQFPWDAVDPIRATGKIPYLRVLPRSTHEQGHGADPFVNLPSLLAGNYDAGIRAWAQAAKAYYEPLIVEFAPEANGRWYPWNGLWNGAGETLGYGDPAYPDGPERYRDAYRRFIDICRQEGVTNITWVFHIDSQPKPVENWNRMAYYYPGDDYIDWIGVSVFGAQYSWDYWDDFTDVLDRSWAEISQISPTKPIAIVEFAVVEDYSYPNRKASWINRALTALKLNRYDRIKAISYWHEAAWDVSNNDLRISSSQASLDTYRWLIADPFFVTSPEFTEPPAEVIPPPPPGGGEVFGPPEPPK